MHQRDTTIHQVATLLQLVQSSRIQTNPELSEEQHGILIVTKEHISLSQLSIPVFIKTIDQLAAAGYLQALSIFEDKWHQQLVDLQRPDTFADVLSQLESSDQDTWTATQKTKSINPLMQQLVPQKYHAEFQEYIATEDIAYSTLLQSFQDEVGDHQPDDTCIIVLSPFRQLARLIKKLEDEVRFEDIKDPDIWYDSLSHTLHYFNDSLPLGKATRAHEALRALFATNTPDTLYFSDIPESSQDPKHKRELRAYYDSLYGALGKDPRLKDIFSLHSDRIEIKSEYQAQTH